jgi:hypothetical protein
MKKNMLDTLEEQHFAFEQLPRQLQKKEAYHTPKIKEYILSKYGTCVCEVKIIGRKLEEHQIAFMKMAAGPVGICFKSMDDGRRQPPDLQCYKNAVCVVAWINAAGKLVQEEIIDQHYKADPYPKLREDYIAPVDNAPQHEW